MKSGDALVDCNTKAGKLNRGLHVTMTSDGRSRDQDWRFFMESIVLYWPQLDMVQHSTHYPIVDFTPFEKPLIKKTIKLWMFRRQHICPSVCSLLLKLMLMLYKMRPSQKAEPKPGWGGVARNLDKVSVTLMTSQRDIFFKLHGLENTLKQAEVDLYGDF